MWSDVRSAYSLGIAPPSPSCASVCCQQFRSVFLCVLESIVRPRRADRPQGCRLRCLRLNVYDRDVGGDKQQANKQRHSSSACVSSFVRSFQYSQRTRTTHKWKVGRWNAKKNISRLGPLGHIQPRSHSLYCDYCLWLNGQCRCVGWCERRSPFCMRVSEEGREW